MHPGARGVKSNSNFVSITCACVLHSRSNPLDHCETQKLLMLGIKYIIIVHLYLQLEYFDDSFINFKPKLDLISYRITTRDEVTHSSVYTHLNA